MLLCAQSFQLCLTLCNHMDYSPPGSFVHRQEYWQGLTRGSCCLRDGNCTSYVSHIAGRFFTSVPSGKPGCLFQQPENTKTRGSKSMEPLSRMRTGKFGQERKGGGRKKVEGSWVVAARPVWVWWREAALSIAGEGTDLPVRAATALEWEQNPILGRYRERRQETDLL